MWDFWVKSITNLILTIMDVTWKLHRIRFEKWIESDNVIKTETDDTSYWSSQDALYRNRMHTIEDAWQYYQKEFITP